MNNEEKGAVRHGVSGAVNYIRNPPASDDEQLTFFSEAEENSTMLTLPGREVWIRNGRELASTLDREGFKLISHQSAISDFDGIELDPTTSSQYMEELGALVVKETGAVQVIGLGGAKQRFSEGATDKLAPLFNAKPARYPHADNTDTSSAQQIKMFVEAIAGLKMDAFSRYALFNIWRCVSPAPQDCPLAVCDATSIAASDEVPVTAVTMVHGVGEVRHATTSYLYNPQHRWHYFPDMTRDEVIVFKTHDTDENQARRVAHTAFDDPTCPPGTHARASVEARILAIFE
ncbi:MAG: hypothetical protein ACI9JM_000425 [Halioglobus sp.]|jgi:hypothetical protein